MLKSGRKLLLTYELQLHLRWTTISTIYRSRQGSWKFKIKTSRVPGVQQTSSNISLGFFKINGLLHLSTACVEHYIQPTRMFLWRNLVGFSGMVHKTGEEMRGVHTPWNTLAQRNPPLLLPYKNVPLKNYNHSQCNTITWHLIYIEAEHLQRVSMRQQLFQEYFASHVLLL